MTTQSYFKLGLIVTETLGQVGLLVDEDLRGDDVAERLKGLEQVWIAELLW